MLRVLSILLAVGFALTLTPDHAQALRCGTHLIGPGDTRIELVRRCGEPMDVSRRVEERIRQERVGDQLMRHSTTVIRELLTYNFGPTRLMRRVEVVNGLVARVSTLGRGYNPEAVGGAGRHVHLGDSPGRVRAQWGEPADSTVRTEQETVAQLEGVGSASALRQTFEIRTDTYNFGPHRFMRRVTFRDGQVVRIETLGHGF